MLGLYRGRKPALYCPTTGACVAVFPNTAKGWSKAVNLAVEITRELQS